VFLFWRGRGLLGIVAIFLPLATCAGLSDWDRGGALLIGGLTLAGGGWVCRHFGRKWNQGSGFHSLYFLPLEVWGWIYLLAGAAFALLAAVVFVRTNLWG
jgi:hypothetical protein